MVGLVIVSHSATLAEGVAELARGMGAEVPIELAGGIDAPEPALGTDATRVLEAIERADQGDGVLVLMDLGSAVLSAEMALDLLPEERRERVVLSEAPLAEGAVAAAVTAKLGASLADVAAEARGALEAKATHLGSGEAAAPVAAVTGNGSQTITLIVRNPLGLHARPAARFVQTAGSFDADVTVTNLTAGRGPASGRSLNAIATLGVRQGHEIAIAASGSQAGEALAALEALAARDFDEEVAVQPPAPPMARPQTGPPGALVGLPGAPGIALGAARHFRVPAPEIPTEPAADPEAEWDALQRALERVRAEIRATRDSVAARAGEYSAAIFDAHLLFLEDEALLEPARRAIFEQRRNAAQAWHEAAETVAAEYRSLDDEYLRARAEDLAGVARQVVAELVGGEARRLPLSSPGLSSQPTSPLRTLRRSIASSSAASPPPTARRPRTARSSPARSGSRLRSGSGSGCWTCPKARRSPSTGTQAPSSSSPPRTSFATTSGGAPSVRRRRGGRARPRNGRRRRGMDAGSRSLPTSARPRTSTQPWRTAPRASGSCARSSSSSSAIPSRTRTSSTRRTPTWPSGCKGGR